MRSLAIVSPLAALAGGLFAAYIDFHATEVLPPMLAVLLSAMISGAVYPRLAWLAALIIPACMVAAHEIAPHFGIVPVDPGSPGSRFSLMILALPAALSAYLGAGMRLLAARTLRR